MHAREPGYLWQHAKCRVTTALSLSTIGSLVLCHAGCRKGHLISRTLSQSLPTLARLKADRSNTKDGLISDTCGYGDDDFCRQPSSQSKRAPGHEP